MTSSPSEKEKFTHDVRWVLISMVAMLGIRMVRQPLVLLFVIEDDYGYWGVVLTLMNLVTIFGYWFVAGVTKFTAEYNATSEKRLYELISTVILLAIFSSLAVTAAMVFLSDYLAGFFKMEIKTLLITVAFSFPFSFVLTSLVSVLQGLRWMKKLAIAQIAMTIFSMVSVLSMLYLGFGINALAIDTILYSIFTVIVLFYLLKTKIRFTLNRFKEHTKNLAYYGLNSISAGLISYFAFYSIGTLVLAYYVDAKEVAYYYVATGFISMMWMVPTAINKVAYPAASEYWAVKKTTQMEKMVNTSLQYSLIVLSVGGVGLFLFIDEYIALLYPNSFQKSAYVIWILLIGGCLFGMVKSIKIFGSVGRPDIGWKINLITILPNFFLSLVLVQWWGIWGVAIATTVSTSFTAFLTIYYIRKVVQVKIELNRLFQLGSFTFFICLLAFIFYSWFGLSHLSILWISLKLLLFGISIYIVWFFYMTKEDHTNFLRFISIRSS